MMKVSPSATEVRELIARRAYELYKHRGDEIGDELSDWLKAEGEMVEMLLTETQETSQIDIPNGRRASRSARPARSAKAANGARPRVNRRPKRNIALNGNPA
jgi:hypothetical protein